MVDLLGLCWEDFVSFRESIKRDETDERIRESVESERGEHSVSDDRSE